MKVANRFMQNKLRAAPRSANLNLVGGVTRPRRRRSAYYLIATNCYNLYTYVRRKLSHGVLLIPNVT
jgi:hypothetical protein